MQFLLYFFLNLVTWSAPPPDLGLLYDPDQKISAKFGISIVDSLYTPKIKQIGDMQFLLYFFLNLVTWSAPPPYFRCFLYGESIDVGGLRIIKKKNILK